MAPADSSQDPEKSLHEVRSEAGGGNFSKAAEHMELLLRADLPGFAPIWKSAPELEPLRESEPGRALTGRLSQLEASWRSAQLLGLAVLQWRPPVPQVSGDEEADPYTSPPPALLRAGVFLPEQGRFLAAGPREQGIISAHLSSDRKRALLVRGNLGKGLISMLTELSLRSHDAAQGTAQGAEQVSPPGYSGPEALQLTEAEGTWLFRVRNSEVSNPRWPQLSAWYRMDSGAVMEGRTFEPSMEIVSEGVVFIGLPAGWERRGGALIEVATARRVELGEEHAHARYLQAVVAGDGLWIASIDYQCDWRDAGPAPTSILRHAVDRIAAGGQRIRVHVGPGSTSLQALPDGRVLMQVGQETRLLPAGTSSWDAAIALPAGLILTRPLTPRFCFET